MACSIQTLRLGCTRGVKLRKARLDRFEIRRVPVRIPHPHDPSDQVPSGGIGVVCPRTLGICFQTAHVVPQPEIVYGIERQRGSHSPSVLSLRQEYVGGSQGVSIRTLHPPAHLRLRNTLSFSGRRAQFPNNFRQHRMRLLRPIRFISHLLDAGDCESPDDHFNESLRAVGIGNSRLTLKSIDSIHACEPGPRLPSFRFCTRSLPCPKGTLGEKSFRFPSSYCSIAPATVLASASFMTNWKSLSAWGAFTRPSFGPVLLAFLNCHPSICRFALMPWYGGVAMPVRL